MRIVLSDRDRIVIQVEDAEFAIERDGPEVIVTASDPDPDGRVGTIYHERPEDEDLLYRYVAVLDACEGCAAWHGNLGTRKNLNRGQCTKDKCRCRLEAL